MRCIDHLSLSFKCLPTELDLEQIEEYLPDLSNLGQCLTWSTCQGLSGTIPHRSREFSLGICANFMTILDLLKSTPYICAAFLSNSAFNSALHKGFLLFPPFLINESSDPCLNSCKGVVLNWIILAEKREFS